MIIREHYIQPIRSFYDSDLIKIITGIRRCGKSVILDQVRSEISKYTDNIIYMNFEDRSINANIQNDLQLIDYINKHRKKGKCFVFLDEIQMLDNWQLACRTLRLNNISLFITGSNSKLLSGEFTKELSGRYVSFRIRPFVYKEIVEYANQLNKQVSITDYLIYGGFPKIIELDNKDAVIRYLNDLDETIVFNDILNRYNIRKTDIFKRLVNFVLVSNARIFSAKSIHNYLKKEHITCSINTIMKYLDYLEEAYIITRVKQYSKKAKRELDFYVKLYNEDVAFNTIRCIDNRYDLTHNLENIVYNELIYMGYSVLVYNNNGLEIDFIAEKSNKKYLIQVAYSIVDEKAYNREFKAFSNLDNTMKKIIITTDDIDYSTSTVEHLSLSKFLMLNDLT